MSSSGKNSAKEKVALELLLSDPRITAETRTQASISLREVSRAIAVIDKSPAIADALQAGLILADVFALGRMAEAGGLTVSAAREILGSRLGTDVSAETAQRIATNFYLDRGLDLSPKMYSAAAEVATHNPGAGEVVLGRYIAGSSQSYEQIARTRGATYFAMGDWDKTSMIIGAENMWNINRQFLDREIAKGKTFTFTSDPTKAPIARPLAGSTTTSLSQATRWNA